jgi:dihydrofolate reductase
VAVADNGVIGVQGALPWHLPDDLKRFKRITLGHPVLMGRRTFASLARPLPGRRNLVLTRAGLPPTPGVELVPSIDAALALCSGAAELFVIGGSEVYRQALPLAARIELTEVHACPSGDAHFPQFDRREWREIRRDEHPADDRHAHPVTYRTLERRVQPGDRA